MARMRPRAYFCAGTRVHHVQCVVACVCSYGAEHFWVENLSVLGALVRYLEQLYFVTGPPPYPEPSEAIVDGLHCTGSICVRVHMCPLSSRIPDPCATASSSPALVPARTVVSLSVRALPPLLCLCPCVLWCSPMAVVCRGRPAIAAATAACFAVVMLSTALPVHSCGAAFPHDHVRVLYCSVMYSYAK
jgi:hypothetical protein